MKAKKAHKLLEGFIGETLYREARKLYQSEVDNLIALRSHDKKPTRSIVEGALSQVKGWFRKVAGGLSWKAENVPEDIIKREASDTWVRYSIIDPVFDDYRKRAKLAILKGSPVPLLDALTPDDLDAAAGIMIAKATAGVKAYVAQQESAGKKLAERLGKRICPYGVSESHCEHQETYSVVKGLPTSTDQLIFVCSVDKCIKEAGNG